MNRRQFFCGSVYWSSQPASNGHSKSLARCLSGAKRSRYLCRLPQAADILTRHAEAEQA